jgi:hypothetical protein
MNILLSEIIEKLHVFSAYYTEINAQVAVSDTVECLAAFAYKEICSLPRM